MQLTKEQIDKMEKGMENFVEGELVFEEQNTMRELLRGYRRYLEAVEHHTHSAKLCEAIADKTDQDHGIHRAAIAELDEHRSRLDALQKGQD